MGKAGGAAEGNAGGAAEGKAGGAVEGTGGGATDGAAFLGSLVGEGSCLGTESVSRVGFAEGSAIEGA